MGSARMLRLLAALFASATADVLVTGATGRAGALVYKALKDQGKLGQVRALVRDPAKAKNILNCSKCDESEGIYKGDVTKPDSMKAAFKGVTHLAIATGVHGDESDDIVKAVEWDGVRNQVKTLLADGMKGKRVAFVSSMGTTGDAKTDPILMWKLNAEAFIMSTGVAFTIIKPCGLSVYPGNAREDLAGHDDEGKDTWFNQGWFNVPRADVATAAATALAHAPSDRMRFDMCAKYVGTKPISADTLLERALWPWQKQEHTTEIML